MRSDAELIDIADQLIALRETNPHPSGKQLQAVLGTLTGGEVGRLIEIESARARALELGIPIKDLLEPRHGDGGG
jgi:hypothetical protein